MNEQRSYLGAYLSYDKFEIFTDISDTLLFSQNVSCNEFKCEDLEEIIKDFLSTSDQYKNITKIMISVDCQIKSGYIISCLFPKFLNSPSTVKIYKNIDCTFVPFVVSSTFYYCQQYLNDSILFISLDERLNMCFGRKGTLFPHLEEDTSTIESFPIVTDTGLKLLKELSSFLSLFFDVWNQDTLKKTFVKIPNKHTNSTEFLKELDTYYPDQFYKDITNPNNEAQFYEIIKKSAKYFGISLASLVHCYNPSYIILDGRVFNIPGYFHIACDYFNKLVVEELQSTLSIENCSSHSIYALGAIKYVLNKEKNIVVENQSKDKIPIKNIQYSLSKVIQFDIVDSSVSTTIPAPEKRRNGKITIDSSHSPQSKDQRYLSSHSPRKISHGTTPISLITPRSQRVNDYQQSIIKSKTPNQQQNISKNIQSSNLGATISSKRSPSNSAKSNHSTRYSFDHSVNTPGNYNNYQHRNSFSRSPPINIQLFQTPTNGTNNGTPRLSSNLPTSKPSRPETPSSIIPEFSMSKSISSSNTPFSRNTYIYENTPLSLSITPSNTDYIQVAHLDSSVSISQTPRYKSELHTSKDSKRPVTVELSSNLRFVNPSPSVILHTNSKHGSRHSSLEKISSLNSTPTSHLSQNIRLSKENLRPSSIELNQVSSNSPIADLRIDTQVSDYPNLKNDTNSSMSRSSSIGNDPNFKVQKEYEQHIRKKSLTHPSNELSSVMAAQIPDTSNEQIVHDVFPPRGSFSAKAGTTASPNSNGLLNLPVKKKLFYRHLSGSYSATSSSNFSPSSSHH